MSIKMIRNAALLGLSAAILAACGTGTVIRDDGTTDAPKWRTPKAEPIDERNTFDKMAGTFPNVQSLAQVRSGMTKDQIYELLGRPQYSDGWRPREWNYLFSFTTKDGVASCQYKILFDKEGYARSFYWNPVEPKDGACPAK